MSETQPEFDRLSTAEKVRHVQDLWDRIAADVDSTKLEVCSAQQRELDRRLALHAADPHRGATWETVKARLGSQ